MPGEGSIFRLSTGRWRAQVSIGPRTHRQYRTRTLPTRSEARVALVELRDELRAGRRRPQQLTTGAYLEQWVRDARNIRPNTRRGYLAVVTYHLVPHIGHLRLVDLNPLHVEGLLTTLAPTLSPKSLRNVHAVLRRALNQAVRAELIPRNVAGREYVDTPRVPDREPDAFSTTEVRALLDAVHGDRLEALYRLAIGTGMRSGELLGLAWEDVDIDGGRLLVRRELVRRGGRYLREEPKTEGSKRTVPLSPALVAALKSHREQVIAEGFVPTATGPVFVNRSGGPINGSWLTHHAQRLYAAAGIRRLDFKALRATFSSRLFEAGVPDMEIAQLMGHTRVHTTRRHYIALGDRHASALEAIEELVG
jgi:integrase